MINALFNSVFNMNSQVEKYFLPSRLMSLFGSTAVSIVTAISEIVRKEKKEGNCTVTFLLLQKSVLLSVTFVFQIEENHSH